MKQRHRSQLYSPGRGWLGRMSENSSRVLCGALLLGMFAGLSALAQASGAGNGSGGMSSGGDETVGTLPSFGGGSLIRFVRRADDSRPAVCLQGTLEDLNNTILHVDGSGDCSVTEIDPLQHVLRLEFHDAVRFQFDRDYLHLGGVSIGLSVPGAFRDGHLTAQWAGRSSGTVALHAGLYNLPLASMDALGRLTQAPLTLLANSPTQASVGLSASSHDGVLVLTQRR
jgi:hypothetical protein